MQGVAGDVKARRSGSRISMRNIGLLRMERSGAEQGRTGSDGAKQGKVIGDRERVR